MFILLTYAALALLADQASKRAVHKYLLEPVCCGPLLQLREVRHRARLYKIVAFRTAMVFVWCLALVSAVWLCRSGVWPHGPGVMLGLGCALGGAAGNLSDILRQQYVIDFIDLGWWPVFNLADVAIVAGVAAVLYESFFGSDAAKAP